MPAGDEDLADMERTSHLHMPVPQGMHKVHCFMSRQSARNGQVALQTAKHPACDSSPLPPLLPLWKFDERDSWSGFSLKWK